MRRKTKAVVLCLETAVVPKGVLAPGYSSRTQVDGRTQHCSTSSLVTDRTGEHGGRVDDVEVVETTWRIIVIYADAVTGDQRIS